MVPDDFSWALRRQLRSAAAVKPIRRCSFNSASQLVQRIDHLKTQQLETCPLDANAESILEKKSAFAQVSP
jgi:hypothetical protein